MRVIELEEHVPARQFPDWSMGYAAGTTLQRAAVPGHRTTFDDLDFLGELFGLLSLHLEAELQQRSVVVDRTNEKRHTSSRRAVRHFIRALKSPLPSTLRSSQFA